MYKLTKRGLNKGNAATGMLCDCGYYIEIGDSYYWSQEFHDGICTKCYDTYIAVDEKMMKEANDKFIKKW